MGHLCWTQTAFAEHTSTEQMASQSRKTDTAPSGVILVRSQELYQAAKDVTVNTCDKVVSNLPQIWALRQQLSLQCN